MNLVANGIDYSAGYPGGLAMTNDGWEFAARYLSEDSRGIKSEEKNDLIAHGRQIVAIAEYDKVDDSGNQVSAMWGGREQGKLHAAYAKNLHLALSLPVDQPIYFTLDVDPSSIPWEYTAAYLDGCADILGIERVGLYAGIEGIRNAMQFGKAKWFWLTYAWSWDDNGNRIIQDGIHLYQYDIYGEYCNGIDVDLNNAFQVNYGQHGMFDGSLTETKYAVPVHPPGYAASLAERYPPVLKWDWEGQKLTTRSIRCNALLRRNTNQYAAPSIDSEHAGDKLLKGTKVSVERITDVKNARTDQVRSWVTTGRGTWIPEDVLNLDFTITPRKG